MSFVALLYNDENSEVCGMSITYDSMQLFQNLELEFESLWKQATMVLCVAESWEHS